MKSMLKPDEENSFNKIWDEYKKTHGIESPTYVNVMHEWQLCPKCNGEGQVLSNSYFSNNYNYDKVVCDVCNGKKIISKVNGQPPE